MKRQRSALWPLRSARLRGWALVGLVALPASLTDAVAVLAQAKYLSAEDA